MLLTQILSPKFALNANFCQKFAASSWLLQLLKHENQPMKIGKIIRALRLEKKATLEDIAFIAGTDAANLSRIERCKQNATPEMVEKIAKDFGFPVSTLYLMAEQSMEPYQLTGRTNEIKKTQQNLEDFVTKFMLLNSEHQQMLIEFMGVMLKSQKK